MLVALGEWKLQTPRALSTPEIKGQARPFTPRSSFISWTVSVTLTIHPRTARLFDPQSQWSSRRPRPRAPLPRGLLRTPSYKPARPPKNHERKRGQSDGNVSLLTMSFEAVMPPYNASDPNARFLSSSCLDFLLIELVPMAYRIANEVDAAALDAAASSPPVAQPASSAPAAQVQAPAQSSNGTSARPGVGMGPTGGSRRMDEDEEREAVFYRLEVLGYRVGQGLVERYVCSARSVGASRASVQCYSRPSADLDYSVLLQVFKRQAAVQRHSRCDKVLVQRSLDARFPETGGQSQDESQGTNRSPAC